MSLGVRISNVPPLANASLIKGFLSKVTTDIESIEIQNKTAIVLLKDEGDLDSVLMLDGQELLGYSLRLKNLEDPESEESLEEEPEEKYSEPEILIEAPVPEVPVRHEEPKVVKSEVKETVKTEEKRISNGEELRKVLQGVSLKPRRAIDVDKAFGFVGDTRFVAMIVLIALLALTLSDLLG
jgi:hypothetical protein